MLLGPRDGRLFAVYTPATGARRRRGVVLCPPAGQEYLRAHRSLILLTKLLSKRGYPVLRLDYFGTGDSDGDAMDFALSTAESNVEIAVEELATLAPVDSVTLIGLRLGATVAAMVGPRLGMVDQLVLWETVWDGAAFADEVETVGVPLTEPNDGFSFHGFPYPRRLLGELRSLGVDGSVLFPGDTLIVGTPEGSTPPEIHSSFVTLGGRVTTEIVDEPPCWTELEYSGAGAVPVQTLNTIATWTP